MMPKNNSTCPPEPNRPLALCQCTKSDPYNEGNNHETLFLTTATATVFAASAALAATAVKDIEVKVDLAAIENISAAQVWTTLGSDLETAIAERLVGQLDEDGATVNIDIDEVELANSFQQAIGFADSKLTGDVDIDVPGLGNNDKYTLTVRSEQAVSYFPDGTAITDLTTGSAVFYRAMVNAFADNVVEKLK